jgi:hypothetical protein
MASKYITERHIIALMSRELRALQSLEYRGVASMALTQAGFTKQEVSEYIDRAIGNERTRRVVMGGRHEHRHSA